MTPIASTPPAAQFVDPRTNPSPAGPRAPLRVTADAAELAQLHELCGSGRLYDVERWIQTGRPLQLAVGATERRRQGTALEIALERQDQALILLLVANGYDLTLEPKNPLDTVLSMRRRDLLDLLLAWGGDPRAVCVDTLLETYDSQLFERFRGLGLDLTRDHAIAHALGDHTSNKPLFGFVKRHRGDDPKMQEALDIALAHHAGEGHEKGVMLCVWAGANPHTKVPWLRYLGFGEVDPEDEDRHSAVEAACSAGNAPILEKLGPNPAVDDFDELYRSAANEKVIAVLLRQNLPTDAGHIVAIQIARAQFRFGEYRPVEALRALFAAGVRWQTSPAQEIANARRDLLRCGDYLFADLMKLLAAADHCSREVLTELARTPSMRERMTKVGLIPVAPHSRSAFDRVRPAKAREVLDKLGIERPKPKTERPPARLYPTERIGGWRRDGRELRLDRSALFERVWTVPVEALAKEWGLSGRGLAKACRRLRIPVPPRGYWARVAAGQNLGRPRLPSLPPGQAEVIVIRAPRPAGGE
jgi:ankyrin repeat protein